MSNKRELAERLEQIKAKARQFAPKGPPSDEEIITSARTHLPNAPFPEPSHVLARLTPHTPAVDGVASVTFQFLIWYETGLYPASLSYAVMGGLGGLGYSPLPVAEISLASALFPTPADTMITCRIYLGDLRSDLPAVVPFNIEDNNLSPPLSLSVNARDSFSFVVPAGTVEVNPGEGAAIYIYTKQKQVRDEGWWVFFDCTIIQPPEQVFLP